MSTAQIRKAVKEVLANHQLENHFRVRRVGFVDLARAEKTFVTIEDWKPSSIANEIEREVRQRTGAIVQFSGAGIVG